ncbi:unnamed protein product, partial [Clonostachys byssicola]
VKSEAWCKGIQPKWQGTWNLHNPWRFMKRTSSSSPRLCLDLMEMTLKATTARPASFLMLGKKKQGKPSVAMDLGVISDVGYVPENNDVMNRLLHRGSWHFGEDEMLQMIDLCLVNDLHWHPQKSELLTGMKTTRLRQLYIRARVRSGV